MLVVLNSISYIMHELRKYSERYFSFRVESLILSLFFFVFLFCLLRKTTFSFYRRFFCSIYGTIIAHLAWFGRTIGQEKSSINTLFSTYYQFGCDYTSAVILNIVLNFLLFVPLGIIMGKEYSLRKSIIVFVGVSVCIEVVQIIFGLGVFEICDIIHNTFGAMMGFGLYKVYYIFLHKKREHLV